MPRSMLHATVRTNSQRAVRCLGVTRHLEYAKISSGHLKKFSSHTWRDLFFWWLVIDIYQCLWEFFTLCVYLGCMSSPKVDHPLVTGWLFRWLDVAVRPCCRSFSWVYHGKWYWHECSGLYRLQCCVSLSLAHIHTNTNTQKLDQWVMEHFIVSNDFSVNELFYLFSFIKLVLRLSSLLRDLIVDITSISEPNYCMFCKMTCR